MSDPRWMTESTVWVTFMCDRYSHMVGATGGGASVAFDPVKTHKVFCVNNTDKLILVSVWRGPTMLWSNTTDAYQRWTWEPPGGTVTFDRITVDVAHHGCVLVGEGTYSRTPLDPPSSKPKPTVCPCGIDRRDCEYHK